MRGRFISGPAQLTRITCHGTRLSLLFIADGVTLSVTPTLTSVTLNDQFAVFVPVLAGSAEGQGVAGPAQGEVVVPLRVGAGVVVAAHLAYSTPTRKK